MTTNAARQRRMGRHRRHRRLQPRQPAPSLSIANAAVFEGDAAARPRSPSPSPAPATAPARSPPTGPSRSAAAVRRERRRFRRRPAADRPGQLRRRRDQPDDHAQRRAATPIPRATRASPSPFPTRPAATHRRRAARSARSSTTTARRSLVSINDVTVSRGQCRHHASMTFTVTRTGGTGAFNVDYATADGSATAPAATMSPTSGTLNFAAGENQQDDHGHDQRRHRRANSTETLPGPALQRRPTAPSIADGTGIGTIANDDPIFIHDIQGTSYFSPILAAEGINGFNIASTDDRSPSARSSPRSTMTAPARASTSPRRSPTGTATRFTSEGIFVMTRNDAGVGTVVSGRQRSATSSQFTASVMEYQAFQHACRAPCWSTRPASRSSAPAMRCRPDARRSTDRCPNAILTAVTPDYTDSSDGAGDTFDASLYALSYFETVEGMLVTIPDMVVADGFVSTSGGDPIFQAYSRVQRRSPTRSTAAAATPSPAIRRSAPPDTADTGRRHDQRRPPRP